MNQHVNVRLTAGWPRLDSPNGRENVLIDGKMPVSCFFCILTLLLIIFLPLLSTWVHLPWKTLKYVGWLLRANLAASTLIALVLESAFEASFFGLFQEKRTKLYQIHLKLKKILWFRASCCSTFCRKPTRQLLHRLHNQSEVTVGSALSFHASFDSRWLVA